MKPTTRRKLRNRFANFETLDGALIYVPWGAGFVYCGLFDLKAGYAYALLSAGVTLIVWGVRKAAVDRVKQAAALQKQVEEYHAGRADPAPLGR